MTDDAALRELLRAALDDLEDAGAAWLEARAAGQDTDRAAVAIREAERATRRLERKLRKINNRKRPRRSTP